MSEYPTSESSGDPSGFAKALSRHGYPFHYRTLRTARESFENHSSNWMFQVSEFPVEVRGKHSRIDYVLQRENRAIYLVVECKRANPSMKRWCFAQATYTKRNPGSDYLLAERVLFEQSSGQLSAMLWNEKILQEHLTFQIALEMKLRSQKGDEEGAPVGRTAIEDAATQVNLCLNGLIEFIRNNRPPAPPNVRNELHQSRPFYMTFIPVVVTTADLYAARVDLAASDIETGEIDPSSAALTERPWVFLQYPVSPGIRHSIPQAKPASSIIGLLDLGKSLEETYLRTVAIVQGKHLEHFLSVFSSYFD